ncbi:MAG TPA: tetratricopeptide repeat protein, partial [Blastocatellia bacterium]|nr:tetratricopeptide repeat protein [Blastocatellia bacterium]
MVQTLRLGDDFEREIKGGETQSFALTLSAGQFVYITVDQRHIDVVVALTAPGGQRVVSMDSPNGDIGLEPLAAIAGASGDYRVEVTAAKGANTGHYRLKVQNVRTPTPEDVQRVQGEALFSEGLQLFYGASAEKYRGAITKCLEASGHFKAIQEPYRLALVLNIVGLSWARLSDHKKALEYYQQALPLFRQVASINGEADVLNNLGGSSDFIGEVDKAMDYYLQALDRYRAAGFRHGEADPLNNLGKVFSDRGEFQKALDSYEKALALFRDIGDVRRQAIVLDNIGLVYALLGDPDKSLQYSEQALPLRRAAKQKGGEATTLQKIGFAYGLKGDTAKSLEYFNKALPLHREAGDKAGEAITLNSLGLAQSVLGDQQAALDSLESSLALRRAAGDRRGEAITMSNMGRVYHLRGELDKSLQNYNDALSIFKAVGDQRFEARTLKGLAELERDRKNLTVALSHITTAIDRIELIRQVREDDLRASFFASMRDYYELQIDVLMQLHEQNPGEGHDVAAFQTSERARARVLLESLNQAQVEIRQGAPGDLLDREQKLLHLMSAKAEYRLRRFNRMTPAERESTRVDLDALLDQFRELQSEIKTRSPRYSALVQPQPLSLKEIQERVLGPGTLLLEYALGERRSYLWVVGPSSIKSFELGPGREIQTAARRVYELLTARNLAVKFETARERSDRIARGDQEFPRAAEALSRLVLAPAAAELGKNRLVIVGEGALQSIPFSALPAPNSGGVPLLVDHEIVSQSSASVISAIRQEEIKRKQPPKTLAILADPVFEAADPRVAVRNREIPAGNRVRTSAVSESVLPRLPFTRREAE